MRRAFIVLAFVSFLDLLLLPPMILRPFTVGAATVELFFFSAPRILRPRMVRPATAGVESLLLLAVIILRPCTVRPVTARVEFRLLPAPSILRPGTVAPGTVAVRWVRCPYRMDRAFAVISVLPFRVGPCLGFIEGLAVVPALPAFLAAFEPVVILLSAGLEASKSPPVSSDGPSLLASVGAVGSASVVTSGVGAAVFPRRRGFVFLSSVSGDKSAVSDAVDGTSYVVTSPASRSCVDGRRFDARSSPELVSQTVVVLDEVLDPFLLGM